MGVAVITSRCGVWPLERSSSALVHAEAVLFVDHGQLQICELDRVFDQRMRADDDFDAAICRPARIASFSASGVSPTNKRIAS